VLDDTDGRWRTPADNRVGADLLAPNNDVRKRAGRTVNHTDTASLATERSITEPSTSGPLHDLRLGETNAQHHTDKDAGRTVNARNRRGRPT
jgi:hypothetical protein